MSRQEINVTIIREDNGEVYNYKIGSDDQIEVLKAIVMTDCNIAINEQVLLFNNKELQNTQTIEQSGIKNNDVVYLLKRREHQLHQQPPNFYDPFANIDLTQTSTQQFRQQFLNNPQLLQQIQQINPQLANAITNPDTTILNRILQRARENQIAIKKERELERRIMENPFDVEAQKELEARIHERNLQENFENALEYNPEAFGRVIMLYIDCQVNKVPVKAFVDSGAQMTIMSKQLAEKCGILRLMDHRWSGIAKGVGTAKIIGRVHITLMTIGKETFQVAITILDNPDMEFLLGLDMLKRHQCIIDLKENALKIGNQSVPFLHEKDLPKHAKETAPPSPLPQSKQPTFQQQSKQQEVYDETKIKQLMDMGFPRQDVIKALRDAGGNVDAAASILFGF